MLTMYKIDHGEEQAQQAVEHMCFLSDVNKLYEHALGSYDIELALMVAQQTHQVSILSRENKTHILNNILLGSEGIPVFPSTLTGIASSLSSI